MMIEWNGNSTGYLKTKFSRNAVIHYNFPFSILKFTQAEKLLAVFSLFRFMSPSIEFKTLIKFNNYYVSVVVNYYNHNILLWTFWWCHGILYELWCLLHSLHTKKWRKSYKTMREKNPLECFLKKKKKKARKCRRRRQQSTEKIR